jgi:lysophospholipase L1-like esterase
MRFSCLAASLIAFGAVAYAEDAVPLDTFVGGRAVIHANVATTASYVGGRTVLQRVAGAPTYTYAWPGVYFEAAFRGDTVALKTDDDQNDLHLYVDGALKLTLQKPGRTTLSLGALGPGPHVVRLEKASETQSSSGTFDGFTVPAADDALPAPRYDRRIEFIGDSFTVGYGDGSRGQTCTTEDVSETTDTSRAFGPLTAKHFGAAYRIDAYSGDGVVRNYSGIRPAVTLPVLYRYALFDGATAADDAGWTPDVVVVGLGTNDFSTPLGPNERWKTREDLRADFVAAYAAFVRNLAARWPGAHFILMAATDGTSERIDTANLTAEVLKNGGLTAVEVLPFGGLDYQACHGHPSLADHAALSRLLIERISQLPKFGGAEK